MTSTTILAKTALPVVGMFLLCLLLDEVASVRTDSDYLLRSDGRNITSQPSTNPSQVLRIHHQVPHHDDAYSKYTKETFQVHFKNSLSSDSRPSNLKEPFRIQRAINSYSNSEKSHLSFEYSDYQASVKEDVPIDTKLVTVSVKPLNSEEVRYYSSNGNFTIKANGDLVTNSRLDADDNGGLYQFTVYANRSRSVEIASASVRVFTTNTNDEPPRFTQEIYTSKVDENAKPGALVATVIATDKDGDRIKYGFSDGQVSTRLFKIDENTGVIRINSGSITFDEDKYELNVTATDDGSCCMDGHTTIHTSTALVIVSIIDVNDNKPVFEECSTYKPSIEEGKPIRTFVIQVKATDKDRGKNKEVRYSVVHQIKQNEPAKFEINPITGDLTTNKVFDREGEDGKFVSVTVKATDQGDPPLEGICSFRINIADVNDNAPIFDRQSYHEKIPQDKPVDSNVFHISATDDDADENALIVYSFEPKSSPSDLEFFSVNKESGWVTLKKPLHSQSNFNFKAVATDKGNPPLKAAVDVYIEVVDRNIKPPIWENPYDRPISIPENTTINKVVATVKARPADTTKPKPIIYQLMKGNSPQTNKKDTFIVQPRDADGEKVADIVLNAQLDYEDIHEYNLTIRAESIGQVQLGSETTVYISVTDVNDELPLFTPLEYGSVLENEPPGTTAIVINAIDKDGTYPFNKVYYSLAEGSDKFKIDRETGEVTSLTSFNREQESEYAIKVETRDGAPSARPNVPPGEPNKFSSYVIIHIGDKNDNSPKFEKAFYEAEVKENEDKRHTVVIVTAKDEDQSSKIRYEITDGNIGGAFAVHGDTGVIFVAGLIDYETNPSLTVVASDGLHEASTLVKIKVLDVNDMPPKFNQTTYEVTLWEENNEGLPQRILQVFAIDGDKDRNQEIVYFLTGYGTDNPKLFDINRTSGEIYVLKSLDRDWPNGQPQYRFTVFAEDEGGHQGSLTGFAEVIVKLKDINDNDPIFEESPKKGSVTENQPNSGELALVMNAVDYDDATEGTNAILTYRIIENVKEKGQDVFSIHPQNAEIRTAICCLDRETVPEYRIIVQATDGGGRKGNGTAIITVKDVNDNPPRFESSMYNLTIDETDGNSNKLPGEPILIVKVLDEDLPETNKNYYTIVRDSGPGWDLFNIVRNDETTGALKIKDQLDYENEQHRKGFRFSIQVDDTGGQSEDPQHTATAVIVINLRDINDNKPQFDEALIIKTVPEDSPVGTSVAKFSARDKDNNGFSVVQYYIDRATNRRRHFVISEDGTISIQRPLDRETIARHEVKVIAYDDGKPSLSATATLIVNVSDVNDNAPRFEEDYRPYVEENSKGPFPQHIIDVYAVDDDDYAAGNGPPFKFLLDPDSLDVIKTSFIVEFKDKGGVRGEGIASVFTNVSFDREMQRKYFVPIIISDAGNPPQTGTSTLTVRIKDQNDNNMKDGATSILVYNYKGKAPDMIIGRVYADDPDDDDWYDKTYKWEGQPHPNFRLNSSTGEITMLKGTLGKHVLDFIVEDRRWQSKVRANVTVTIKEIPEEAVEKSGSIRIKGMSEEEFIEIWDYKARRMGLSKKDLLRKKIAEILKIPEENIDIFTVMNSPGHTNMVDVRFSAHSSPYYKPEKLNGILSQNRHKLEEIGLDLEMIGIDECLYENKNCEESCTNSLNTYDLPYMITSKGTGLVGVRAVVDADCVCRAREGYSRESCKTSPCYNGGACSLQYNGVKCQCEPRFGGPRCQETTRSFLKGNGYAWFSPLQQCEDSHLSLEFITQQQNGLLFYNGPIAEPVQTNVIVQDFVSLELLNGKPRLLMDFGSGTLELQLSMELSDGEWHRIDVFWEPELVRLVVDMCAKAGKSSDGERVDRSMCEAKGTPPGFHEYLNVNAPLQLGGVAYPLPTGYNWNFPVNTQGFDGCIKNFFHNSEMYDLGNPGISSNSSSGCSHLDAICQTNEVVPLCGINGVCVASFDIPKCLCNPGWSGIHCETKTNEVMFKNESYVKYVLKFDPDPYKSEIQLKYRAHFPDGQIMLINGQSNNEYMILEIVNSTLQFRFSFNDQRREEKLLALPSFHANDGNWHTLKIQRFGTIIFMYVDGGGGRRYNEFLSYEGLDQFINIGRDGVTLGGYNPDIGVEISDYNTACMDDVRFDTLNLHLPLPPSETDSHDALISSYANVENGCISNACIGIVCPPLRECIDIFFDHECRCVLGYEEDDDKNCRDIDECENSPCKNGGVCENTNGTFLCHCPPSHTGLFCDVIQERREVKLSMGALAAILVCVLVILVLVLVLVVYTRNRRTNYGPVDPDDDVRENIINYNDEGGGEDDMHTYDIGPLRIPIDPGMPKGLKPGQDKPRIEPVQNHAYSPDEPNVGEFIENNLGKADDDPDALPLDDLRVYAYEGGGSDAGSLSSLASGTDDNEQDFDYLNSWGPRFQKLADMYGQGESEEE